MLRKRIGDVLPDTLSAQVPGVVFWIEYRDADRKRQAYQALSAGSPAIRPPDL